MIVVPRRDGSLEVVTQIDHAHLSAEVLRLWRADGMPEHPRRHELLHAVRAHDNGWQETDSAPRLDFHHGDRPYDFLRLPDDPRVDIWRRGCERFLDSHPYTSLLVAEHARHLLGNRPEPIYRDFLVEIDELRERLLVEIGLERSERDRDYSYLELTDLISLIVCSRWRGPFELRAVRLQLDDGGLRLDPFPLAGSTTFRIRYRRIPARPFRGDAELGGELAAAVWREREIKLSAWS